MSDLISERTTGNGREKQWQVEVEEGEVVYQ
jgi:hypothetical protein